MVFSCRLVRKLRKAIRPTRRKVFFVSYTLIFRGLMSPPPNAICVDGDQKPLLVSVIDDLDAAETNKGKQTATSVVKNLLKGVPPDVAIEHDDGSLQRVRMSDGVQEKGTVEKCVDDETEKGSAEKYEFLPAADSHTRVTPNSLCEKFHSSDDYQKSSGNFYDLSVACDTQSLSQKRKKKIKANSEGKTFKRCKTSFTSFVDGASCDENGSCFNAGKTACGKTVGGGKTKTNQTGNGGCPAEANNASGTGTAATAGMQGNPCGNCGGGGGAGGGDDGENPYREVKQLECDRPPSPVNDRKQKHSADMDVDGSNSPSQDSGMDIAGSPPTGTDIQMVSVTGSRQVARPGAKPPEDSKFLVNWHCAIIHLALHNNQECKRCQLMNNLIGHVFGKGACTCNYCKVWPTVLKFHQQKCKSKTCPVCVKVNPVPLPVAQPVHPGIQHHPGIQQTVLNVPTSGTSLDAEEAVIYCDDSLQGAELLHFKEHEHYTFKHQNSEEIVGKGGHGTVHDIVLHPQCHKSLGFSPQVVVKKTTLGEDEKEVLKTIAGHPNFVKTYLVVNKTEVTKTAGNQTKECKHRIFMQKCDMSLKDYIDKKWGKGEVLNNYEAMHYWTQVLDAVVHLHTRRTPIIHKDIKAANVLLTFETNLVRAMLADFDAVKLLHNEFTQPGLIPRGTMNFIAPEVQRWEVHGRPADIYSMGKFLLELLCRKERNNTALAVKKLKEIDFDLGMLIERCLEENPNDRPTAVEIRDSEVVQKYLRRDIPMSEPRKA